MNVEPTKLMRVSHTSRKRAQLCVCRWIETAVSGYGPLPRDSANPRHSRVLRAI